MARTLITGATSDIGRHIALELAQTRSLVLCGRSSDGLESLRNSLPNPNSHVVLPIDLALPGAADAALAAAGWMADGVESFIHVAGVFRAGPLRTFTPEISTQMMQVGFLSAAEICRSLLRPKLNGANLRDVVFISSVAAIRGVSGYALYAAQKAACEGFARALAIELAPRVRVNCIRLGGVMTSSISQDMIEVATKSHPLGLGDISDVAAGVEFLLSPAARWMTGQSLTMDGGWSSGGRV